MPGSAESRGVIRAEVVSVPGELLVHWGERTSQPGSLRLLTVIHARRA